MVANSVYPGCIAIIGGGITGVTLAVALLRRGIRCTIYEQAGHFGEIGAGIAFSEAATRAMNICSPDIVAAFHKVKTSNVDPAKQDVFFNWYEAMSDEEVGQCKYWFTIPQRGGLGACHRAHYIAEVSKLLPDDTAQFGKRLVAIDQTEDLVRLQFADGTEAFRDAVVGADGIKSFVRSWILGDDPAATPEYTHKYAYRGLIPMERAAEALGDDLSRNSKFYSGQDGHVLTFPVAHGKMMNVVMFFTDPSDWPDHKNLVRSSNREQIRKDFRHFGATVQRIIDLLEPDVSCWAIFDIAEVPYYNKGRVLMLGDAAHASSPHQAGGGGLCIEDCAVLAELLGDPGFGSDDKSIQQAFKAFSDQRLPCGHAFVEDSRRVGEVYDWRSELASNKHEIHLELQQRFHMLWNVDTLSHVIKAKQNLGLC